MIIGQVDLILILSAAPRIGSRYWVWNGVCPCIVQWGGGGGGEGGMVVGGREEGQGGGGGKGRGVWVEGRKERGWGRDGRGGFRRCVCGGGGGGGGGRQGKGQSFTCYYNVLAVASKWKIFIKLESCYRWGISKPSF